MARMDTTMKPAIGNLAWAPSPTADSIDFIDRYNGVPTLGIIRDKGASHLFWCVEGYTTEHISCWLYVPLTPAEEARLSECDPADILDGIVVEATRDRAATVGVGWDNILIFEREWLLPVNSTAEHVVDVLLRDVLDAMRTAMAHGLPASRAEGVRAASEAVRDLVNA